MTDRLAYASSIQLGLWLLDQVTGGAPIHNLAYAYGLKGTIDVSALRLAFDSVVKRHEVFRTVFEFRDCELYQRLSPESVIPLECQLLESKEEADAILAQLASIHFDLSKGPLYRACLLTLSSEDHVLCFVFHHAIFDGLSMIVFLSELSNAYQSEVAKQALTLPNIIQYSTQATDERFALERHVQRHLGYWRRELLAVTPVNLPTKASRPSVQSFRGKRRYFAIDVALIEAAKQLGAKLDVTVFTIFLAGFFGLLFRYLQQEDLVVGIPIATRTKKGTRTAIGPYLNLLPVRVQISDQLSFGELVTLVKRALTGVYLHGQVPFEKLVEGLGLMRDRSRNALIDVFFQYSPRPIPSFVNVEAHELKIDAGSSQFDLSLYLYEDMEDVSGYFEYSTDLFEEEFITDMASHYVNFLRSVLECPESTIARRPYLTADEYNKLVDLCNQTDESFPRKACVHELFEAQVQRMPERIALQYGKDTLTYEDLNAMADRLASHLRSSGIGPECFVGVLLPPSLDIVVSLLGVMKTGAAYIPLDPSFPHARLDFMLQDSGAAALVTCRDMKDLFPSFKGNIILVDSHHERELNNSHLQTAVSCDSACYLIYTSGSTGIPKGVQIAHRSVVNFLSSMKSRPGIDELDVMLSVTSISFDISVLEMFLPLIVGAKVVLAPKDLSGNGSHLSELLESSGATIMQATPTTWQLLIDTGWKGKKTLKILCGGEALSQPLASQLLLRCDSLWNMYGPTETTIWSMRKRITSTDEITLGAPIANTQIYVLDRLRQLVPLGVEGELYIGGEGLSIGYLKRDDLTSQRFIENPFRPGNRLYRSGDLVRRNATGEIEFIGRADYQVKVRGFRVELGEIETVMRRCSDVSQAVVSVEEDPFGGKRIVGYYTTATGQELRSNNLREILTSNLPSYMVPSEIVFLEVFPTTPNGKIDRNALRASAKPSERFVEISDKPSDATQSELIKLWEKILGRKGIGLHDNFFELGGHSILAAHLFVAIEKQMGRRLPLATLFQHQTIDELARILRASDQNAVWSSLVQMQSGGRGVPLFLIHGAEGNVLLYRSLSERLGKYRPVFGLQSRGLDGVSTPKASIEDMAAFYIDEVKKIYPNGPFFFGGYCMGGTVALEMARQLSEKGCPVGLVALFETYNIRKGPVKPTLMFRCVFGVQNIFFHLYNLLEAGLSHGGMKFFIIKSRTAWRRLISREGFLKIWRLIDNNPYPHKRITNINDAAQMKYEPHYYEGTVVLFRPKRWFISLTAPAFGWLGLLKTLEIVTLPVSPRGMLVPPFVSALSEELEDRLAAIESKMASATELRSGS